MGHLQTQNLTRAPARPEVAHWGPTAQQSPAGNERVKKSPFFTRKRCFSCVGKCTSLSSVPLTVNVTVVLGVLTFGLQLCLVLYFAFRCRRLENKIQKPVSKGAGERKKGDSASCTWIPGDFQLCFTGFHSLLHLSSALSSVYRGISKQASYQRCSQDSSSSPIMPVASCQHTNPPLVFAPSIPWDLVQG